MKNILITGGTGLVGSALSRLLTEKGYSVAHLSREENLKAEFPAYAWSPSTGSIDPKAGENAQVIIHLAGAGVADKRWTAKRKNLIIESRVNGLKTLEQAYSSGLFPKVEQFLAASAVGFYGDRGEELLDEEAGSGKGFLAEICQDWEAASESLAAKSSWQTTILRIGIVLSTQGGALQKMLPSYKLRTGAYFGNGKQYVPWVHIQDLAAIFLWAIEQREQSAGIFNACAPNSITSKDLAYHIARALDKKALILPAPAWALRLALGEMADALLMSNHCSSQKLLDAGFKFAFPESIPALKDIIEKGL